MLKYFCVCGLLSLPVGLLRADDAPITAPEASLQKLAGGFSFTEGAASDPDGNVFFTDQPNDRILKWSVKGKGELSTFKQPCGRANGLCVDAKGRIWACADEQNEMWQIDRKGKVTVIIKDNRGKLLNGPNDIWLSPKGLAYFTDPYYQRPWWKRGPKEIGEWVYLFNPKSKGLIPIIQDLKKPNGIIGSPDGKKLYVADIDGHKTFRYDIARDGTVTNKNLFCEMGSDGMTIDDHGNIYLTGKGVFVFNPLGKQIQHIPVPEDWCGNVCFGGNSKKTLFITASKGFYSIDTLVKGVGSQ
jgi:gluconolactonase